MEKRKVCITECDASWELRWEDANAELITATATAAAALAVVQRLGHELAAATTAGGSVVVIEWCPVTRIGRQVVRALCS